MGKAQTNEKHPKGFYACCITFMFERLAFYGAKPILLLFLITATLQGGLGIERTDAAVMAANLTAYTYMAPLIGGIISDRWLGARYAISLGYIIMAIGYLVGWKATGPGMVNLMIILVSIGTGLFKGNLNALIGRQYQNKELLDAAFSIQYSYVNVGAFVGSLLTGFLYLHLFKKGDVLGFRQCFFVASIWCIVGLAWFVLNWKNLQGQGVKPFKYLTDENGNVIGSNEKKEDGKNDKQPLTKLERNRMIAIILVSALSVIFWLFYYQQDLALVIYMTDYVKMRAGHGGSDTDNLRVGFGKFHQCISEYVLEKRGHSFGVGNETFAGDGIEFAGSMPFGSVFLCRTESFSFDSVQVQDFRSLHIFDIT
mgnify:CR=1 FL=1